MKAEVVVSMVFFCNNLFAPNAKVIEQAPQNYLMSLNSKNESLIESATFYSVIFTLFYEDRMCKVLLPNQINWLLMVRLKPFVKKHFLLRII